MTALSALPEYLAGYVAGYAAGVDFRLNPPTVADIEVAARDFALDIAEPKTYTEWKKLRAALPGGTAAETAPTPELDAEHASRAALADARSVPPPQVRPSDAAPSAAGRAAVRSDEITGAMESAILAMIQVFRDNDLVVAASLCDRSLQRLRGEE